MLRRLPVFTLVPVVLATLGCSSVDSAAEGAGTTDAEVLACADAACGGDPTGQWDLIDACDAAEAGEPVCTGAGFGGAGRTAWESSVAFEGDGTFTWTMAWERTLTWETTAVCWTGSCADLEATILGQSGTTEATCAEADDGGCHCDSSEAGGGDLYGEWGVVEDIVQLSGGNTAEGGSVSFCEIGDSLSLKLPSNDSFWIFIRR